MARTRIHFIGIACAATFLGMLAHQSAPAQRGGGGPLGGNIPSGPAPPPIFTPPPFIPPPPPPPPPPPVVTLPTPPPTILNLPPVQPNSFVPVLPIDLTQPFPEQSTGENVPHSAETGLKELSASKFPEHASSSSAEGLIVKSEADTVYERTSPTSVKLTTGTILVSSRQPTKYGLIETPQVMIAIDSAADLLITQQDDLLRIKNLSGLGIKCKTKFKNTFASAPGKVLAVAAGFEMVAANHKLIRTELRPPDGIARRGAKLLALGDGHLGICEISVESVLKSSTLIATLSSDSNRPLERRVLSDMSKMAAVLNYVNGGGSFEPAASTGLAAKPGKETR